MSVMYNPLSQMYQLTLKGAMSHQVELGSDPRGNITRIDNALAGIPRRMQNVENKLNDLNQQMATAKAELGKDSFSFTMVVDADDAPQKVAQVVQEQLQTTLPGFTLELKVEPKKQRVQDMQDGNFEIGLTRWGPDYADPMTYLGMWVTGNSNNYGLWSDADYDAVIAECTTGDLCTDPEGRWEAMYDAESIVLEQAAIFPLYGQCNAEMISSAVTGVDFHPVALNRVFKDAKKSV